MPWNIFNINTKDEHYGLCSRLDPWTPVARGKVLQLVCELTEGMTFVECDPKNRGRFVLEGGGRRLVVWQNRKAWTKTPGTSYTVEDVPAGATKLLLYGWDGLRRTIELGTERTVVVDGLTVGETYMFLVR